MKTFYGFQTLALLPPGDPSHTSSKCARCISTLFLLQIHTGLLLSFYQRSCPTRDHTKDVHRQLLQHWEIWFHCIEHQQEETNRERLSSSTMRRDSHITWWTCAQNSQVGNNPTCRFYTDSDWIKNKFTPTHPPSSDPIESDLAILMGTHFLLDALFMWSAFDLITYSPCDHTYCVKTCCRHSTDLWLLMAAS